MEFLFKIVVVTGLILTREFVTRYWEMNVDVDIKRIIHISYQLSR
jgi:hypothetical protein